MRRPYLLLLFSLFLTTTSFAQYPQHWWKYVDPSTAKKWEVLPQDAGPEEVVLSKRNELGLLSNFAHTPFEFRGRHYESMEGLWQSLKYPEGENDYRLRVDWAYNREVVQNMVGYTAKKAGSHANYNMDELEISWVTLNKEKYYPNTWGKGDHYYLIKSAIRAKVQQNPKVKSILKATGNLYLIPDHHIKWYLPAAWSYHKIYMEIRRELFY
ncbi:MAG: hypothetical protein KAG61_08110 [Bacteriovoracaceae bacterium]|nr:hypothetical protein [Bacteriovoracaceae bacterium]